MKRTIIAALIAIVLCIAAVGAQAQAPANPTTVTVQWVNPKPVTAGTTIDSTVILRATCPQGSKVTGVTQPDGAIVGTCSPAPAPAAFVSYYAFGGTVGACTLLPGNTGCWLDNNLTACIATGCVYEIENICVACSPTNAGPSSAIAVGPPVAAPPPPPSPPPPATGLTMTAQAKNSNGKNETLTASWKDAPNVPTGYFLWGGGKLLKAGNPAASSSGSYSLSWSGASVASALLDVCDPNVCLPPASF